MPVRLKKLLGTFVILAFLIVYCLLVMVLAVNTLPASNGLVQLIFYIVFGLLWIVPVGLMIKWMQQEPSAGGR